MKSLKKRFSILFLLFLLFLLIARIQAHDTTIPKKVFRTSYNSGDISSIDTALAEEPTSIQLVDEMTVGLLRQNDVDGSLQLGMATSYVISEDQKQFTFTLRTGIPWVRYDPALDEVVQVLDCAGQVRTVTAADFADGIERMLRPETASPYAYVANKVIAGALAYNNGITADFSTVGVKALDANHLEITFTDAGVFNLNVLSLWMTHAQPQWLIEGDPCTEKQADRWIEGGVYEGYGPFTLKEWVHDSELSVIRNPFWTGTETIPQPQLDEVQYRMISDSMALAEYEAGNLDYAVSPTGDYDRILTDPSFEAHRIFKPINVGTEALMFNIHLAPTDDVRVRRALSLSLDRQAIAAAVKTGQPAHFFINPSVAGAPKVAQYMRYGADFQPEMAKALLKSYCAEKDIQPHDLEVTYYFSTSDQHKIRAEVIAAMWENTLGIHVTLENSEWAVFNQERKEGLKNVYRTAWIQDYLDANNFTADVFLCPAGYYQSSTDWPTEICADTSDPLYQKYAEIVTQAGRESDPAVREKLYAESEDILINQVALISPLSWNNAWVLRNPRIQAPISVIGYDRWEKWRLAE